MCLKEKEAWRERRGERGQEREERQINSSNGRQDNAGDNAGSEV